MLMCLNHRLCSLIQRSGCRGLFRACVVSCSSSLSAAACVACVFGIVSAWRLFHLFVVVCRLMVVQIPSAIVVLVATKQVAVCIRCTRMSRTLHETHGHDGLVNTACRISSDTLTQVLQSIRVRHSWRTRLSFVPRLSSSLFSSSCSRSPPALLLNMPPGVSRSCCPGRRYSGGGGTTEGACARMCFLCGVRGNLCHARGHTTLHTALS